MYCSNGVVICLKWTGMLGLSTQVGFGNVYFFFGIFARQQSERFIRGKRNILSKLFWIIFLNLCSNLLITFSYLITLFARNGFLVLKLLNNLVYFFKTKTNFYFYIHEVHIIAYYSKKNGISATIIFIITHLHLCT